MIRFWAAAKPLQTQVKAGALEAICFEQTWPLSLIRKLSVSIFLSAKSWYCICFSPSVSLSLFPFYSSLSWKLLYVRYLPLFPHLSFLISIFPLQLPPSPLSLLLFSIYLFFLPPGSQGKGKLSVPAEGAEPADWGGPQGARWNPRPFGPAWRRAPPQGRGAIGGSPAPVVATAGNPRGVLANI